MGYNRSAVFVIDDNNVLLLYRKKDGKSCYVVPGGTIENGENSEQTAIRELKEETNLDIQLDKLLWTYGDDISNCHYYLSSNFKGKVKLGGEEAIKNCVENQYRLDWIKISDIENIVLYPVEIHNRIQKYFKNKKTFKLK